VIDGAARKSQSSAVLVNAYANRGNKTVCFTAPQG
jgi:hypothetical protein